MLSSFRNALFSPVIGKDEETSKRIDSKLKLHHVTTTTPTSSTKSSLPAISANNQTSNSSGISSAQISPYKPILSQNAGGSAAGTASSSLNGRPPLSPVNGNHRYIASSTPSQNGVSYGGYSQSSSVSNNRVEDEDEDDLEDIFNPYQFMVSLPPHHTVKEQNKIVLPPALQPPKLTLVLDLDETLVHCSVDPIPKPDIIIPVLFNGVNYQVYVRKRPFLDAFLDAVTKQYEVVVFTASQRVYADKLLDFLDPKRSLIHHRLFRDSCLCVQGNYIKDLEVLDRAMHSVSDDYSFLLYNFCKRDYDRLFWWIILRTLTLISWTTAFRLKVGMMTTVIRNY